MRKLVEYILERGVEDSIEREMVEASWRTIDFFIQENDPMFCERELDKYVEDTSLIPFSKIVEAILEEADKYKSISESLSRELQEFKRLGYKDSKIREVIASTLKQVVASLK